MKIKNHLPKFMKFRRITKVLLRQHIFRFQLSAQSALVTSILNQITKELSAHLPCFLELPFSHMLWPISTKCLEKLNYLIWITLLKKRKNYLSFSELSKDSIIIKELTNSCRRKLQTISSTNLIKTKPKL